MDIIIAKNIGFCGGVKRAIGMALEANKNDNQVFTWGDVVHNEIVLRALEKQGINSVENFEFLHENSTLVIRAHGIGKELQQTLSSLPINLIDATCPKVKSIHNIVEKHHKLGYQIAIFGKPDHPEVVGINGWCENSAIIMQNAKDLNIPVDSRICLVSQTTASLEKWNKLTKALKLKYPNLVIFETICQATIDRQVEAEKLASECDAIIVIGGKNSSNTQKLVTICAKNCLNVISISQLEELEAFIKQLDTNKIKKIGVISGASTPKTLVDEIVVKLEEKSSGTG